MKFQKSSEYAIRSLLYLASRPEGILSVSHIHQALDIPYKYLGQLMLKLASRGFVRSVAGKQGGYALAKDLSSIYLYEIVESLEGVEQYEACALGHSDCSDENRCALHLFWVKYRKKAQELLKNLSLKDLLESGPLKI